MDGEVILFYCNILQFNATWVAYVGWTGVRSSVRVKVFDVSLVAYVGLAYLVCAMHLMCALC